MFPRNPSLPGVILSLCVLTAAPFAAAQDHKTWKDYGGGADNTHYSALTQIDKSNVGRLEVAWTYPEGTSVFNPVVVDNVLYGLARGSALVALDATSGKEIWIHEGLTGIPTRGINYWESKDRKDRRLIFSISSYLQEIDANTGKSIRTFGNDGFIDLRVGLGRDVAKVNNVQTRNPGKVFEDLIILGSAPGEAFISPPGDFRAYNVVTGKLAWQFHTVPHPGEFGYETNPKDAWKYLGGDNTWGELTVDEKRGIAYFPTGSPTYDFYGADRIGSNLFGDCLVALDARTGKYLWHYQMVHHDLWDFDNTSAPQLTTVTHNGKKVDAVAQAGKTGFLYVFDRVTGKPLWPIEERPVPKSDVKGEQAWATQPYPTAPPPFARQKFTPDDINPYLPDEQRALIKDQIQSSRNEGIYTPPAFKGTVSMPGNQGGSNWGTTAADPNKGLVFVLGVDAPAYLKLVESQNDQEPGFGSSRGSGTGRGMAAQGLTVYQANCQTCHGAGAEGTGTAPSLLEVTSKLGVEGVRSVVKGGRDAMPSFPNLTAADTDALLAFLVNPAAAQGRGGRGRGVQGPLPPVGGLVVESGPVPAAMAAAAAHAAALGDAGGRGFRAVVPYPEGVADLPPDRYYTGYGVSENAIKPPWSTLTAYDLNTGTIKWQIPAGDDLALAAQGITGTGSKMLRTGIMPTAAGLVFLVGGDHKIRAYDEETGKVLWTGTIGGTSTGIPAMYEVNGRQYLTIAVQAPGAGRRGGTGRGQASAGPDGPVGYIAFALPKSGTAK